MKVRNVCWSMLGFVALGLLTIPYGITVSGQKFDRVAYLRADDPSVYSVRAFGAKGDGKTLDTPAINKAIDAAAGLVAVPCSSRPEIICRFRFI